jgi:hypothetical protein
MRTILIIILSLLAGHLFAAETNHLDSANIRKYLDPAKVLETNGVLTITDGSSFYVFRTNGTFSSMPVDGFSGRTFHGTWTPDFSSAVAKFTAVAQMGWINGISSGDEYRKIVFFIYMGHEKAAGTDYRYSPTKTIFDCYFIIDELVKIPKPDKSP